MSKEVTQDWANREFIETIEVAVRKCVDFLNSFSESAKYRLSAVDARLSTLERKLDFLEASLEHCDPSKRGGKPVPFKTSVFDPSVRRKLIEQSIKRRQERQRLFTKNTIAPSKANVRGVIVNQQSSPRAQQKQKPINNNNNNRVAAKQINKAPQQTINTKQKAKAHPKSRDSTKLHTNALHQQIKQKRPQTNQKNEKKKQQKPPAVPGADKPKEQQKPPVVPAAAAKPPPIPAVAAKPPPIPSAAKPPPVPPAVPPPMDVPVIEEQKQPPPIPGQSQPGAPPASQQSNKEEEDNPGWPHTEQNCIDIKFIKKTNGAIPGAQSAVEIEYTGFLDGGKQFIQHKEVVQLGKKQNIKGLEQAITKINVGSKIQLWIPFKLAYGARGAGNLIPPNCDLTFHLSLHRIVKQ